MRRGLISAATIAALLIGGTATGLPANQPATDHRTEWRQRECRYARWDGRPGHSPEEVRQLIVCAVAKWPVSGGVPKALSVAACESGLNERASNGGRYLGVYQHSARYWPSRVRTFAPQQWDKPLAPSAFNGRANVVVSIRMASSGGWGPWSCA
jgi:hypothetical protein